ncbi:MAG: hypothetical protein K1X94_28255 [Sandaracinaceae bacterium]|nr:hypothetical protein [Sandaracinaceae bacterium]
MRRRAPTRSLLPLVLSVLAGLTGVAGLFGLPGCDCGGDTSTPAGTGVSCATHATPLSEPRTIGRATLTPEDRAIAITGLPETSRWVVARGPALSVEPFLPVLDAIEAAQPDVVLLLGSFGTGERLEELVTSLAELTDVPVLLLPGPRDRVSDLDAALEAHPAPHVIPLAGVHLLEVGAVQLLLAPGSTDPHYVLDQACHVDDVATLLGEGDSDRVRVLVGFDAPAGTPLTAGIDGAEAGSEIVREAMEDAEIQAGLFAGPNTEIGRWRDASGAPSVAAGPGLRVIVPPLAGAALEGGSGVRSAAGPLVVSVGPTGVGPASAPNGLP